MFENSTGNLIALCSSCMKIVCSFVWVDLHVSLRGQQDPKCARTISLVHPPFFHKLCLHPAPINKNITELVVAIQTTLSRLPFKIRHFFIWTVLLTMTDTITLQNIYLSPWITLCNSGCLILAVTPYRYQLTWYHVAENWVCLQLYNVMEHNLLVVFVCYIFQTLR